MHLRRTFPFLLILTSLYCTLADDHHKRVPSGFTGVRGKKSIPDTAYTETQETSESVKASTEDVSAQDNRLVEKRAPSGFMGMRGKKPYDYSQLWEGTYPDAVFKRAPSGFMGMRGKKDMELVGYDDFYKRAPSGFMGMRGKKDYDKSDYYTDKRAPMGFVGMRGKKDDIEDFISEDKRAPQGFFGMRGKKLQRTSGFFGMRGKKYPYEFRGKFVGVRGKKAVNEDSPLEMYRNWHIARYGVLPSLDMNQLLLLLTEKNDVDFDDNHVNMEEEDPITEK